MYLLFIALIWTSSLSKTPDKNPVNVQSDSTKPRRIEWSLLPIVFRSPDTDWAFGLLPQVVFRLPQNDRASRGYVGGYYTLNEQYDFFANGSLWLSEDRDHIDVAMGTKYWPSDFYGLSAPDADVKGIPYTERSTSVSAGGSRGMGPGLRLGLNGEVTRTEIIAEDGDLPDELRSVAGSSGGWLVSLGPVIGLDSRDDVFYPTGGWNVELSTSWSGLVGDYDFLGARLDARTYRRISGRHVLAWQALLNLNTSGVPFWAMRGLGSVVRGYSNMRFLDRQMTAAQVEYRFVPIAWRVGLTAFVGVGSVAARIDELPKSTFRWAAGVGFRFVFMKDAKINIRWDFGFAPGSSGDYLEMSEAF